MKEKDMKNPAQDKEEVMKHKLQNDDRFLEFDGEKLSESSSRSRTSLRWLEITIYRTVGGGYVYHTVGRSRVFRPAGNDNPAGVIVTDEFIDDNADRLVLDPKIGTSGLGEFYGETVVLESDRHRATYSPTPSGLIEAAKVADREGIPFLTRTAEEAIRDAAQVDAAIRDAFFVERVH